MVFLSQILDFLSIPSKFDSSINNHFASRFIHQSITEKSIVFLIDILRTIEQFKFLSDVRKLALKFKYVKLFENEIIFNESDQINSLLILEKGCIEIVDRSSSSLIFQGGNIGIDYIFTEKEYTSIFVKSLDDCQIFLISQEKIKEFFKDMIQFEYLMTSKMIDEIMFFRKFENKEKIKLVSTFRKIAGMNEIIDVYQKNNNEILDKNQKVILMNIFNKHINEIKFNYDLKQFFAKDQNFSFFNSDQINTLISSMKIRNFIVDDILYDSNSERAKKIFVLIKGKIKNTEKNDEIIESFSSIIITNGRGKYMVYEKCIIGEIVYNTYENMKETIEKQKIKNELLSKKYVHQSSFLSDLIFVKKLGKGQFGDVFLVKSIKEKQCFALKVQSKKNSKNDLFEKLIESEKLILKQLDFPMFPKFKDFCEDDKNSYLLMEFIRGMEFFDVIRDIEYFTKIKIHYYFGSLILILEHLHSNSIIYRDLKPENIMVDHLGNVKLIDFGSAKIIKNTSEKNFTLVGTPHYMAPEVIKGEGYGFAADYWSLGVILYEMMTGTLPFGELSEEIDEIYDEILNKEVLIPKFMDEHSKGIINLLLNKNPEKRKNIGAILKNHSYFDKFDWDNLKNGKIKPPYIPDHKIMSQINELANKSQNNNMFIDELKKIKNN